MRNRKTPHYSGREFARMDTYDGELLHAVGASNYQVTRANRSHPEHVGGASETYNHAPMLTYWRGHFYLQYLCNPVDEHRRGGRSLLARSRNGVTWADPVVSFPVITAKAGVYPCVDGQRIFIPEDREAYMHQRVAFFHSSDDRLLVTGFYGQTPSEHFCPWVDYGMGRAVREIYEDGSLGPLYFIKILKDSGWTEEKLPFPLYTRSPDAGFVCACEELLQDRLYTQQWAEEHGYRDEGIHIKCPVDESVGFEENSPHENLSSFAWYHTDENTIMGLWKQAVVGRSDDGGETWNIHKEPSFATSGAKAFGQRTCDGRYAIAYCNSLSSEHRYPLVVVTGDDGARFDDMAAVFYEVPPRRYEGLYKDFGPQYIRGILEGHREYPDGAMWLCHSVNKEDIWVTRIPVPIRRKVEDHANDLFEPGKPYVKGWNVYSGKWTGVSQCLLPDGSAVMRLADKDPCDYARAERIFPSSERLRVKLELMGRASYEEDLFIELTDERGIVAVRVLLGGGRVAARSTSQTYDMAEVGRHVAWLNLEIEADMRNNQFAVAVNGKRVQTEQPMVPIQKVNSLSRLVIRTKPARRAPGMEIEPLMPDIGGVDEPLADERVYYLRRLVTEAC